MEGREMPPPEEEKKGGETKMTYLSPEILAQGVEVEYHKLDYSDEGAMSSGLRFYSCDAEGKKIYLGSLNLSEYGLGRYHTLKRDHIPPENSAKRSFDHLFLNKARPNQHSQIPL